MATTDVLQKIIANNDIHHGTIVVNDNGTKVFTKNTDNIDTGPTIETVETRFTNRFDDINYYST